MLIPTNSLRHSKKFSTPSNREECPGFFSVGGIQRNWLLALIALSTTIAVVHGLFKGVVLTGSRMHFQKAEEATEHKKSDRPSVC